MRDPLNQVQDAENQLRGPKDLIEIWKHLSNAGKQLSNAGKHVCYDRQSWHIKKQSNIAIKKKENYKHECLESKYIP